MSNKRLVLTLTDSEMEALRAAAQREYRPTKDHARLLLRLGLTNGEKHNGAAHVCETGSGAAVTTIQA